MTLAPRAMNRRRALLALFAGFGLAWFTYAQLWPQAPLVVSDSAGYVETAADLRDGHLDQLHDRTPGYPALLVAVGAAAGPNRRLFHAQLVLHFTAIVLAAGIVRRCGAGAGWIAALIAFGLAPSHTALAGHVLSEGLTEVLLVAGVAATLAWWTGGRRLWLVLCAAAVGAAGLVRPVYLPLGLPAAVVLLVVAWRLPALRRRCIPVAVAWGVGSALASSALLGYNAAQFHFPGATPLLGFNLSTRTARFVERLPDEYAPVREILVASRNAELTERDPSHLGQMYIWSTRPALRAATGLDEAQLSTYMLRLNWLLIRRAPLEYCAEVARAAAVFWFPWVPELAFSGSRPLLLAWTGLDAMSLALYGLVTALAASAALFAWRLPGGWRAFTDALPARSGTTLAVLALVAYLALFTMFVSCTIEVGAPRYRAPLDLLLAAAGVLGLRAWLHRPEFR